MAMRPLGVHAANSPRVSSAKRPVARVLDYSNIDLNAPPSIDKFAEVDEASTSRAPQLAVPLSVLVEPESLSAGAAGPASWIGDGGVPEEEVAARVAAAKLQGQLELERVTLAHQHESALTRQALERLTQRSAQLAEGNTLLCTLLKRVHAEGRLAIPFLTVEDELCNAAAHEPEEAGYWEDMQHVKTFYEAQARGFAQHLEERLREATDALADMALKLDALQAHAAAAAEAQAAQAAVVDAKLKPSEPAPVEVAPAPAARAAPAAREPPAARELESAPAPSRTAAAAAAAAAAESAAGSATKRAAAAATDVPLPDSAARKAAACAASEPPKGVGFDVHELHRMKQRFEEIMKKHDTVKEAGPGGAGAQAAAPTAVHSVPPLAGGVAPLGSAALARPLKPVAQATAAAHPPLPPTAAAAPSGPSRQASDRNLNLDAQCDRNAAWLQPSLLEAALVRQQSFDPDEVFYPLTRQLTCDLAEVFGKPDLQKRSRRGGSGEWILSPSLMRSQSHNALGVGQALGAQPPVAAAPPVRAAEPPAPAPASGGGSARLFALDGPYVGMATLLPNFKLPQPGVPLLIGRSSACDVVLNLDDQISRRHMRIECRGGKYLAFDDGSTYGTTINEWQLGAKESAVLRDGDLVLIGASRFRFQIVQ